MWLDELDELRQVLRRRISTISELGGSESMVRYALVNPLLSALGWNLADPEQVRTEYAVELMVDGRLRPGYLDYVLFHDQKKRLVVEAKALGKPLDDGAVHQCMDYCRQDGPGHFVVTDGRQWRGYYLFAPGGIKNNQDFKFDMNESPTMDLLWLWPGNFRGDRARQIPKPRFEQGRERASAAPSPPSDQAPAGATSGVPLPEVKHVKGMDAPRRLIFPNGETKDVSDRWWRIQAATAEWLIDHNHVTRLPVQTAQGVTLLYKRRTNRDAPPFSQPKEVRGHWIDAHANAKQHLTKARQLLESCEVDPNTVHVELS